MPSTASRTTPYFAHSSPPAPVAMLPPTVEIARLAGSGAHHRPCSASAVLSSAFRMPGSTTASRSSGRTSRMRVIRRVERAISPGPAFAPPARPVPAPRVTTGVPLSLAMRSVACTSPMDAACTTARGAPAERCPDLSARASSSAAGLVSTRSPSSARRRASTSRRHDRRRRPASTPDVTATTAKAEADPRLAHAPPRDRRRGEDQQLDDGADEGMRRDDGLRRDEQRPQQDAGGGSHDAGDDVPRERPREEAPEGEGEEREDLREQPDHVDAGDPRSVPTALLGAAGRRGTTSDMPHILGAAGVAALGRRRTRRARSGSVPGVPDRGGVAAVLSPSQSPSA